MADVAGAMGWSIVYVSDIERSRRNPPSPTDIEKLLRFMKKEEHLPEMLRLAAEARRSIVIPVNRQHSAEVTNMLVALAREANELDPDTAREIQELLEKRKGR